MEFYFNQDCHFIIFKSSKCHFETSNGYISDAIIILEEMVLFEKNLRFIKC